MHKPLALTPEERAGLIEDVQAQNLQVQVVREAVPTQKV